MLGPQLVALHWEVLETLGVRAFLEDMGHWGHALEDYTWHVVPPSLPLCFLSARR
jgi:K+ transporter